MTEKLSGLQIVEKLLNEGFIFKDVRIFQNPYTEDMDAVAYLSKESTTISVDSSGRVFELNQRE